ncbi:MAG: carboxypeptidase-like regulatory domain-containing protein, partial [Tannerella sp.]|nr:carboxypeptidase-like regulatory domain-containing protein [Tannerella sp.]
PIVGANVVEKGTTHGVVTDADGNFSLNVSNGAVLVISYLGYNTQEISNLSALVGGGVNP